MPKPRRKRNRKKTEFFTKHKLAVLLILLVIAAIVVSFLAYGLFYGPAVEFTFGGSSDVPLPVQSYQLIAMSRTRLPTIDFTHVRLRNTGISSITVVVTIHALNAVVSTAYGGPYSDIANAQVYLPANGSGGFQVVPFYLTLPSQVSTFQIRVTLGQVLDFSSAASLATSTLASIKPTSPTTLVYSQAPSNPIEYELTQQY